MAEPQAAEPAGAAEAAAPDTATPEREATIADLPDEMLSRIFGALQWNRLPWAAVVCRRWHRVALSRPDCLTQVSAKIGGSDVAKACNALAWLRAYAASRLRSLHLELVPPLAATADVGAVAAGLEALLAACAAAGRLNLLHVDLTAGGGAPRAPWPAMRAGAWLGSLPALQTLQLCSGSLLEVPDAPLAAMTALHSCDLRGWPLQLPATARLPTSVRALALGGLEGPLPQVAELTRLTSLKLLRLRPGGGGARALLPAALRDLELSSCAVPTCLPRLTALTALTLERVWLDAPAWQELVAEAEESEDEGEEAGGAAAALRAALAPLTALRRLALRTVVGMPRVPPFVGALPSLQHFEWRSLF